MSGCIHFRSCRVCGAWTRKETRTLIFSVLIVITLKQAIRDETGILLAYQVRLLHYLVMGTFFGLVALWSHDVFGYDGTNVGVMFCSDAIPYGVLLHRLH